MELPEDVKISNFNKFKKFLNKLFGEEQTNILLNNIGSDEKIINASFGINYDSGLAYSGSLLQVIFEIADYADKINELLPEYVKVDKSKLYKVCLLQHISKVQMYELNNNTWEVEKRGLIYKFKESDVVLRCGERSALIVLNSNIKLSEDEFEAIRVLDKMKESDESIKYYITTLSTIVKQANELVNVVHKK